MQDDNWNALWLPDRPVVKANLGKNFSGVKTKVARNPVTFLCSGIVRGVRGK